MANKVFSISFFFFILLGILHGQENCFNGIDDDGDGLIDIQDVGDCGCPAVSTTLLDLSFEQISCCPSDNNYSSSIDCLEEGWFTPTGSADYFNTCGWMGNPDTPIPPLPFPSGSGAVGIATLTQILGSPFPFYESIANCLDSPMTSGQQHEVSFEVGFGTGPTVALNITLALYGKTDCVDLWMGDDDCMPNYNGWELITDINVSSSSQDSWVWASETFIPTADYAAIGIAMTCGNYPDKMYHFIDDVMITGPGSPDVGNVSSFGDCIDGVVVEVSDVDPSASHQWYLDGVAINGATSDFLVVEDATADGDYQVMVINNNGQCSISDPLNVTIEDEILEIDASIVDVICHGESTGSIDLSTNSNNLPLTFQWDFGSAASAVDGLAGGDYEVTVTDANGCFDSVTITVEDTNPILESSVVTIIQPAGSLLQGSATVNTMGGLAPYSYVWSNGETTEVATNLPVGTNSVVITDSNGCETMLEVIIQEPLIAEVSIVNDDCNLCQGNLEIAVTGGVSDYQIAWDTGSSSFSLSDLCESQYVFTVTDALGTQVTGSPTILAPEPIIIQTTIFEEFICFGSLSNQLETTASGGTQPVTYEWSSGETTSSLSNIGAGSYTLTATDNNGCTAESTYNIFEVPDIVIDATLVEPDCNAGDNGSIDLILVGGQTPYDFLWSDGSTTPSISDLSIGDYTVTVTDALGCTKSTSFTLTDAVNFTVVPDVTNASCEAATDGSIALNVSGINNPSFLWEDGSSENNRGALAPGSYTVIVSDGLDCDLTFSYEVKANALFEFQSTYTEVICPDSENGTIELQVPDQEEYTYAWSNGSSSRDQINLATGSYSVIITNAAGCERSYDFTIENADPVLFDPTIVDVLCNDDMTGSIAVNISGGQGDVSIVWNTGETSNQITNLDAGSYELTAIDDLGCEVSQSFDVTSPASLVIQEDIQQAGCNNEPIGSISLTIEGGVSPYDIIWNTGEQSPSLTGLTSGMYTVDITDANGCTARQEFELSDFGTFDGNVITKNISCFGGSDGSIVLENLTGAPPFDIQVNGQSATSENLNLVAGNYAVVVIDANGCVFEEAVTLTSPNELGVEIAKVDVECHGDSTGEISVSISGGTSPYQIFINGQLADIDNTDLIAGNYNIEVIDANNCRVQITETIEEPDELSLVLDNVISINNSNTTGSASLSASGGVMPYDIQWSNGDTELTALGLNGGNYSVTVTDANNCQTTLEFEIEQHLLTVEYSQTNNLCFGECEASVQIEIIEGDNTVNYSWSNGVSDQSQDGLCNGNYSCTVTDQFGNEVLLEMTIESPDELQAITTVTPISCPGSNDGDISIEVFGGVEPYQFIEGGNTISGDGLSPDEYVITIQDANGCLIEVVETIEDIVIPELDYVVLSPDCSQLGEIQIFNLEEFDQNLFIDDGSNTSAISGVVSELAAGTYTIDLMLGSDCIIPLEVIEIEENTATSLDITEQELTLNGGDSQILSIEDAIQLDGNLQIIWESEEDYDCIETDDSGNCLSIELTPMMTTTILAIITNEMGCEQQFSFALQVEQENKIFVPNIISASNAESFKLYAQSDMTTLESFSVYSRWGVKLYEEQGISMNTMEGWNLQFDGSHVEAAVYVFVAQVQHPNGNVENLSGDITVVP